MLLLLLTTILTSVCVDFLFTASMLCSSPQDPQTADARLSAFKHCPHQPVCAYCNIVLTEFEIAEFRESTEDDLQI